MTNAAGVSGKRRPQARAAMRRLHAVRRPPSRNRPHPLAARRRLPPGPARWRGAPRPHLSPQAPTCGPLSPGDDVFPELPHRPVPGHLLVPRQALRQLDLRGKLHTRNHGDNRDDPRSPATPRLRLGARCDVTRARRPLPGACLTSCEHAGLAQTARHRRVEAGPRNDSAGQL